LKFLQRGIRQAQRSIWYRKRACWHARKSNQNSEGRQEVGNIAGYKVDIENRASKLAGR